MANNLIRIWKNKGKILEGIKNYIYTTRSNRKIARDRLNICRTDECSHYDPIGESEKAIKGKESCGICGCILKLKVNCLSCSCALEELNKEPLWKNIENAK